VLTDNSIGQYHRRKAKWQELEGRKELRTLGILEKDGKSQRAKVSDSQKDLLKAQQLLEIYE
jgi:hypothetical protein